MFPEGVAQTTGSAVDTANRLLELFREDEAPVRALFRRRANALHEFACLRTRPFAIIADLARRADVSYPTAVKIVAELAERGVFGELTGRRRDRVFAYKRYLELLAESTEPL